MDSIPESRIILAMDIIDREEAFDLLDVVHDLVDGVKVNHPLIHSCGIQICQDIKKRFNLPIIGDFKIADVPVTNNKIIDLSSENKIDFLTIHSFIGRSNLVKAKQYSANKIKLFMITELTSSCVGTDLLPYERSAELAVELDFYGAQAPATKPKVIKKVRDIVGDSMTIISCGIGAQGKSPGSAIESGADFEIIGRAIYLDKNPREATKKYIKMIKEVGE